MNRKDLWNAMDNASMDGGMDMLNQLDRLLDVHVPRRRILPTREQTEERLRARASTMAQAAIGKTFTVKTGMNTTVTGEIVYAEFARMHYTARSMQVVWKIIVKSGRAGTRHTFHVRKLPR